jgi:hypothetical protein
MDRANSADAINVPIKNPPNVNNPDTKMIEIIQVFHFARFGVGLPYIVNH